MSFLTPVAGRAACGRSSRCVGGCPILSSHWDADPELVDWYLDAARTDWSSRPAAPATSTAGWPRR